MSIFEFGLLLAIIGCNFVIYEWIVFKLGHNDPIKGQDLYRNEIDFH
jgi:hypothetical protein